MLHAEPCSSAVGFSLCSGFLSAHIHPAKSSGPAPHAPFLFQGKGEVMHFTSKPPSLQRIASFPSHSAGTNFGLEIILRFLMHLLSGMGTISPSLQMKLQGLTRGLPGREPRTWEGPSESTEPPGPRQLASLWDPNRGYSRHLTWRGNTSRLRPPALGPGGRKWLTEVRSPDRPPSYPPPLRKPTASSQRHQYSSIQATVPSGRTKRLYG